MTKFFRVLQAADEENRCEAEVSDFLGDSSDRQTFVKVGGSNRKSHWPIV